MVGLGFLFACGAAPATAPPKASAPAVSATPLAIAVPRSQAEKRAMFAAARDDLARGDAATARRRFAALQPVYPELDDYVLDGLARAASRSGDDAAAETAWSALIVEAPRSLLVPQAQLERGRALAKRDDPGAAGALLAARGSGDTDVAVAANLALGQLALRDGASEAAATYFDAARRGRPGSPPARAAKEQLLALRASHPSLAPRTAAALADELDLLTRERDYPAARRTADALLAVAASPRTLRARAEAEYSDGDLDAAVASLTLLTRQYPGTPDAAEAQARMATLLWNRDRNDEAAAAFRVYLSRYPGQSRSAEALYALGRIAQGQGRDDDAVSDYRRLIAATPGSSQARDARWRIGWIAYRQGRFADAANAFAAAAQGGGPAQAPEAWYWRARALERAGDRAAATTGYRAVLDQAPASYYAYWAEQRLSRPRPPAAVHVAGSPPRQLGAPPAGTDGYHWQKARELQAVGMNSAARRELRAVEGVDGDAPAVAAALPDAYQAVGGYRDAIRLAGDRGATARILYPLAFWPDVSQQAGAQGIDPLMVVALMRQESLFDPAARSPADARGLMQLLPSTAERVARERGQPSPVDHLYEPEINITLGVGYLGDLMRANGGDPLKAFAAYNGGEAALARWQQQFGALPADEFVESITYRETRDYVKKVMGNYRRYQQLYGE